MNLSKIWLKTSPPRSRLFKLTWTSCRNSHQKDNLHSVALTKTQVQNIMRSLPLDVRLSFNYQFCQFWGQCPDNVQPPATFLFLALFVYKLEKNYRSNSYLYNLKYRCQADQQSALPSLNPCPITQVLLESKVCIKGYLHNVLPVLSKACIYSNQTLSALVSKVSTDRSIPLRGDRDLGHVLPWDLFEGESDGLSRWRESYPHHRG